MAIINKVEKTSYEPVKIAYTDKDYTNILDDLINSISGITAKWNTTDANDPGIVLVKLMAILGDMLFYNQDMQSLEVYPNSVTQRKNAASIYKLIGYKMRWYKSATAYANIVNTYSNTAILPTFCTFRTDNGITYCTFDEDINLMANNNKNGFETPVILVQGTPVLPVKNSSDPYPKAGKPWHSIYSYNYTTDDIINNRIYLKYQNVDQSHIKLVDDLGEEWELLDNIYTTKKVGKFFEFGVDVNDQPYIELVDYYNNFKVHKFKLFYIRSDGENGQILANTLTKVTGNVWARSGNGNSQTIYNVSSFIQLTHYDSSLGFNPETPDEARKNSTLFQNTMDTLITLADFERATLRESGVANVRATDLTNDPGIQKQSYIGDINQDGVIDEFDYQKLADYLVSPIKHPLDSYQLKLADLSQDGDSISSYDLHLFYNYLNPTMVTLGNIDMRGELQWTVGNIAMKRDGIDGEEIIDQDSVDLLTEYINLPDRSQTTLTDFQVQLCDVNRDGNVNREDLNLLKTYIADNETYLLTKITEDVSSEGLITNNDLQLLNDYLDDPESTTLTDFQLRIADMNQDGKVDETDKAIMEFVMSSPVLPKLTDPDTGKQWTVGNVAMTEDDVRPVAVEYIDMESVNLLERHLLGTISVPLTQFQLRLADFNQDGVVDWLDYYLLRFWVTSDNLNDLPQISDDSDANVGKCGKEQLSTVETLDGFIVKLYIVPTVEWEDYDDEELTRMIKSDIQEYTMIPLQIQVDTKSVNKYYWTVTGKFLTKTPLLKDELENIIVNINSRLNYLYSVDKMNFNSLVNYKEVIENMLDVDSRILMIDLNPIEYRTKEGEVVEKSKVTGEYSQTESVVENEVHYTFRLKNTTILPGSVMIRVNNNKYVLRDNNNGEIYNVDNILQHRGSINYLNGEIDLVFNATPTSDIVIDYVHNTTNIAIYENLDVNKFHYDSTSLLSNGIEDLI